jgi:hypothetical protein
MLIREFALDNSVKSKEKLLALVTFLKDRAQETPVLKSARMLLSKQPKVLT